MTEEPANPAKPNRLFVTDVAHAPFVYFDNAPSLGRLAGLVTVTLSAQRILVHENGAVATDNVAVAYLRCNLPAARSLRDALDKALLSITPPEETTVQGATRN
jgi:hypothetical protein